MARIGSYGIAPSPVSSEDKLIGTDSVNNDATKNFTIQEITDFVLDNIAPGIIPTLQVVLDNGHSLTNGRNFQGTNAGVGNSGNYVNAFGSYSGYNNAGSDVNLFGQNSGFNNLGANVNAIGVTAAQNNIGSDVNAMGYGAGVSNLYDFVNLLGNNASADGNSQTVFGNGAVNARISFFNITDDRKYELPDASGTLALTSDISSPYLVYTAILSWLSGGLTATVLQNNTGATISWAIGGSGEAQGTASSSIFTINKTWIMPSSWRSGNQYFGLNGARTNDTLVSLYPIRPSDNSSTVGYTTYIPIEIRVYP